MSLIDVMDMVVIDFIRENATNLTADVPPKVRDVWRRTMSSDSRHQFSFTGFFASESEDDIAGQIQVAFTRNVDEPLFYAAPVPLLPLPKGWYRVFNEGTFIAHSVLGAIVRSSYDWLMAYVVVETLAGRIVANETVDGE